MELLTVLWIAIAVLAVIIIILLWILLVCNTAYNDLRASTEGDRRELKLLRDFHNEELSRLGEQIEWLDSKLNPS